MALDRQVIDKLDELLVLLAEREHDGGEPPGLAQMAGVAPGPMAGVVQAAANAPVPAVQEIVPVAADAPVATVLGLGTAPTQVAQQPAAPVRTVTFAQPVTTVVEPDPVGHTPR
jgi:hypothetical protein